MLLPYSLGLYIFLPFRSCYCYFTLAITVKAAYGHNGRRGREQDASKCVFALPAAAPRSNLPVLTFRGQAFVRARVRARVRVRVRAAKSRWLRVLQL